MRERIPPQRLILEKEELPGAGTLETALVPTLSAIEPHIPKNLPSSTDDERMDQRTFVMLARAEGVTSAWARCFNAWIQAVELPEEELSVSVLFGAKVAEIEAGINDRSLLETDALLREVAGDASIELGIFGQWMLSAEIDREHAPDILRVLFRMNGSK